MARVLSGAVLEEIARLTRLYPHPRSALLPALHAAQEEGGYLSEAAMADVGDALHVPLTEVVSVASFYEMFHLERLGRHHIRVCTNLSCYLNGCDRALAHLCSRLGIQPGETTADGRVTLEAVQCLAACEEAPVLLVDTERHPRVTPAAIDEFLARLE
jgi:NADH-quinone oxidoreductase subunit E